MLANNQMLYKCARSYFPTYEESGTMEICQLQYFVMVAEEKSFVNASKRAYVSQQAISRAIQNLENELGVKLFERLSTGVELTEYGVILRNQSTHILALIDAMLSGISDVSRDRRQVINFGMTNSLLDMLSMEKVFEFQEAHPQWKLSFIEGSDTKIESEVTREHLDLGLLSGVGDESKMNHRLICKTPTYIVMHTDHPLSSRETLSLAELGSESFLAGTDDYYSQKTFINACESAGFVPRITYATTNTKTIRQLLALNKGVSCCPKGAIDFFREADLKIVPLVDDPYIFRVYLVNKKGRDVSVPASDFRDYLQNTLIQPS
jgi:DNA-binding transcriptional LysR family regulator